MCLTIKLKDNSKILKEIEDKMRKVVIPLIAKKDIEVFKSLRIQNEKYVSGHGYNFTYEVGQIYNEPKFLVEDIKTVAQKIVTNMNRNVAGGWFGHMHPMEIMMMEMMDKQSKNLNVDDYISRLNDFEIYHGFHSYKEKPKETLGSGQAYCKFIIPKGSKYFESEREYCSNKITFVEVIEEVKRN